MNAERTFITACLFVAATLSSCSTSRKAPIDKEVGMDPYGSVIRIYGYPKGTMWTQGELIAVQFMGLYMLEETSGKVIRIERTSIKRYDLYTAKSRSYAGFIPLSVALSVSQGVIGFITLPINLITTISVATSGSSRFTYTEEDVDYNKLYMFARFPQGLPPGIDLSKIKGRP
jgi:hypothetical protein